MLLTETTAPPHKKTELRQLRDYGCRVVNYMTTNNAVTAVYTNIYGFVTWPSRCGSCSSWL